MSILSELNALLSSIPLPVETGLFSDAAPDEYVVITPLADTFEMYANNRPGSEVQEARISLFTKGHYAGDRVAVPRVGHGHYRSPLHRP